MGIKQRWWFDCSMGFGCHGLSWWTLLDVHLNTVHWQLSDPCSLVKHKMVPAQCRCAVEFMPTMQPMLPTHPCAHVPHAPTHPMSPRTPCPCRERETHRRFRSHVPMSPMRPCRERETRRRSHSREERRGGEKERSRSRSRRDRSRDGKQVGGVGGWGRSGGGQHESGGVKSGSRGRLRDDQRGSGRIGMLPGD